MILEKYSYVPLLKTTDAELKAYDNLNRAVKNNILPIFELTKSRRSKANAEGCVFKRTEEFLEIIGDNKFILDLTTEQTLSNAQIASFLNETDNGYEKWRKFLDNFPTRNVIPIIHWNENAPATDMALQIKKLESKFELMAFRVDASDVGMMSYVKDVIDALANPKRLIIILDSGYVPINQWKETVQPLRDRIREISTYSKVHSIVTLSSSFPKTVVASGYGGDSYGVFPLGEVQLFEAVDMLLKEEILYGDYGSIHPVRYPIGGGGWIPRVDVPLESQSYYYRYRREKGGYVQAAQEALEDDLYSRIKEFDVWGDNEIATAAKGTPNGRNPSHWIAVRANLHMTRQYLRTKFRA